MSVPIAYVFATSEGMEAIEYALEMLKGRGLQPVVRAALTYLHCAAVVLTWCPSRGAPCLLSVPAES
jgi:hypothetical protein